MLRTYFQETFYDMPVDVAQKYAEGIRMAIMAGTEFHGEKKKGFFISKNRGFDDKLYVGNIHRIENRLYWDDEELADDDQIINVVVIDGPVTRDGDGCSYGSKDHRDQIMYANTIPQVIGHIFIINTPGGAACARIDYEQAIADCRDKGKPTVAWVDGMCCSGGQLVASLCDRTIVMNGRHTMGCIGTMCAFWGVANGTVDQDGYRYIELVSVTSPDKNAEYMEAVDGKTEKLQAELDKLGEEFRETVRQNRPLVKEEHLTGKTFDAQDVMGALVDEIGDYIRAIEAVFELAGQQLTAARFVTAEPTEEPAGEEPAGEEPAGEDLATKSQGTVAGTEATEGSGQTAAYGESKEEPTTEPQKTVATEGQTDLEKLNEQQKAAIATNAGMDVKVDDGHVTTTVETMFGTEEFEIAKPQNQNDMKDENINANTPEEEVAATEGSEGPATSQETKDEGQGTKDEEQGTKEEGQETKDENKGKGEEQPAESPATEGSGETATNGETNNEGEGNGEEQPSQEAIEDAQAEIDRIADTLHNAAEMIAEKDKTIAEKQDTIEKLTADIDVFKNLIAKNEEEMEEMRGTIEKQKQEIDYQKKTLADKEAEIKELAGKPTPMTDAASGVPADNGTGKAPKTNQQRIKAGMSYDEIRKAMRGC